LQDLTESVRNSGVLEIRDELASISGGKVLDVGTQHGRFITTMMKALKDYDAFVGIDISENDLEKARERFPDSTVQFRLMNAEELTFEDDAFDTVCVAYSLHHLENPDTVLGEMVRVLKTGGHMIICEMYSDGDQSDAQRFEILTHHLGARLDRMEGIPHFDTFSRRELKDTVEALGMRGVKVFETTWSLGCLYCDKSHECEDPRSDYNLESGREEIREILERARNHDDTDDIQHEAVLLLEKLESIGYHSASQLFFICEK